MSETTRALEQISISEEDISRRLQFVGCADADIARVTTLSNIVDRHVDEFVAAFFDHLASFEEAKALLDTARSSRARGSGRANICGDGQRARRHRVRAGTTGARRVVREAGLDSTVFLGAFHCMMAAIGFRVMDRYADNPREASRTSSLCGNSRSSISA